MDFKKFNEKINKDQFEKDYEEVKKNGGTTFEEIPHGEYVVKAEKMELRETKNGDPMLSIQFRIVDGEHKKACIFYNQVIVKPFQFYLANQFLNSMETDIEAEFHGDYEEYNNIILDIFEACDKLEFLLDYEANSRNPQYNTYEIKEVYDA